MNKLGQEFFTLNEDRKYLPNMAKRLPRRAGSISKFPSEVDICLRPGEFANEASRTHRTSGCHYLNEDTVYMFVPVHGRVPETSFVKHWQEDLTLFLNQIEPS